VQGRHWRVTLISKWRKDLGLARGRARFKHGGMLTVDFGTPSEGPIRRPERGEWTGADKNSSPKRELGLCPNTQPRIPTRACQGRVVTTDLPTLGISPKPIQRESTTQKPRDLGNLESTRLTVHSVWADYPRGGHGLSVEGGRPFKLLHEPSIVHREKWTVREGPADRLPRHGPSGTLVWTVRKLHALKTHWQNG
jgi:hypothetical protein